MTGFEPATTRPPDVDSTGLSYIPNCDANLIYFYSFTKQTKEKYPHTYKKYSETDSLSKRIQHLKGENIATI